MFIYNIKINKKQKLHAGHKYYYCTACDGAYTCPTCYTKYKVVSDDEIEIKRKNKEKQKAEREQRRIRRFLNKNMINKNNNKNNNNNNNNQNNNGGDYLNNTDDDNDDDGVDNDTDSEREE